MATGHDAQWGIKTESVYGTAVVVDEFIPLIGESMSVDEDFTESQAIVAGQRVLQSDQWNSGNLTVEGSIETELRTANMLTLFEHMFGGVTGANPYTYVPDDLTGLGFTCQIGKPIIGGAVEPFTYNGCKVASWEIALAAGEIATLGLDLVAISESTGVTALASASYPVGSLPFKFTHGTVEIANSPANVKAITISGENALNTDRRYIGTQVIAEPIEEDRREYTGSMTLDFDSMTAYDLWRAHTETEVELQLDAGSSNEITITMNCRFDGSTPAVSGRGIVEQDVPFTCIADPTGTPGAIVAVVEEAP